MNAGVRSRAQYIDFEEEFWGLYEFVRPFTMTTPERLYDLYQSVRYIIQANIPGDFIECGVWKGGSSMLIAETLARLGISDRKIQLFDTFKGLPEPGDLDVDILGTYAADRWREGWIAVGKNEVQENMNRTRFEGAIELVEGRVEETLPVQVHPQYALARLDTDWYVSTKVELEVLWPRISLGGILIVDDYGHWQGCRAAVDEFFSSHPVMMHRVDYSCRTIMKVGES